MTNKCLILLENYVAEDVATNDICILNPDGTTLSEAYSAGITHFCYYNLDSTVTLDTDSVLGTGTKDAVTVWLYTEAETVNITACSAKVNHYGTAATVNINTVANNSYHLYGNITALNVTEGHVELCDGSSVNTLTICGSGTSYTFTASAEVTDIIAGDDGNSGNYAPTKIAYKTDDSATETTIIEKTESKTPTTADIAAALYSYNVNYRANTNTANITLNYIYYTSSTDYSTTTTTPQSLRYTDETWAKLSTTTPSNSDNYEFCGWYLDSGFTIKFSDTLELSGTEVKSDFNLYGKFYTKYTVTFNLNYTGTLESNTPATQTIIAGNTATAPDEPTREAYNFLGWYTDSTCSGDTYDFTKAVTGTTGNITLYAGWEYKTYTVTFYNEYEYVSGQTYTAIANPTIMHGDTIDAGSLGIANMVDDSGTPYFPGGTAKDGVKFNIWYYYVDGVKTQFIFGETVIKSDMIIYAEWVPTTVTLTLELNGGTFSADPSAYTKDTETGIYTVSGDYDFKTATDPVTYDNSTPTNISKSGTLSGVAISYEFKGWYSDKDCTTAYTFGTAVTGDITIYAKWDCTTEIINGVIYQKVAVSTLDSTDNASPTTYATVSTDGTTVTFASNSNITGETTTGYYWVITGYVQETIDSLGYYKDGSWLVLENYVYGSPVLEIAAGAFARGHDSYKATSTYSTSDSTVYMTLKNVLVPENIVMVGSQAFLDNKGITSIVFLADTVYFSSSVSESYGKAYSNVSVINYNSNTTNGLSVKDYNSQNYPFYGCTIAVGNDSSSKLTVYYNIAYSTEGTSDDEIEGGSPLNGGVFVVKRNTNWYGALEGYIHTNNDIGTDKNSSITTINWLYIDVNSITQTLKCGSYERGDFDWAGALTDVLTSYGVACCSYDNHVFIASGLTDALSSFISTQLKAAVNSFTAEYGEYINGYTVTVGSDGTDGTALGNAITCSNSTSSGSSEFKINIDTATPYYLVNLTQYLTTTDSDNNTTTTAWSDLELVENSDSTVVETDETTTVSVTYYANVDGTDVYVTLSFNGTNVKYFDYSDTYSTYYGTTAGYGIFAKGNVTVTGSSDFNYKLDTISATTVSDNTVTMDEDSATPVELVWEQMEDNYIYIVSNVAFTYSDGTNTTAIKTSEDTNGKGTPLLASHVAKITSSSLPTASANIYGNATGYYFLGWAAYIYDSKIVSADTTGAKLTFTNITVGGFDNSSTYYAIWGYWKFATDENCTATFTDYYTVATSGNTLPVPADNSDSSFSFFSWYSNSDLTGDTSLTNYYTYYAKAAATTVTVKGVTYTYRSVSDTSDYYSYSYNSYTYTTSTYIYTSDIKFSTLGITTDGYYAITAYDGSYSDSWLVLKSDINGFDVKAIEGEVFSWNTASGSGSVIDKNSSATMPANVIVPDTIVYVHGRAFYKNTTLANIVFLAATVYFNNNNGGSTGGDRYAFSGCNSELNIYYNSAYAMGENKTENNVAIHDTSKEYMAFTYEKNSSSTYYQANYTNNWLYINTAVDSLISGSEIDGYSANDIQTDIIEALQKFAGLLTTADSSDDIVYYQNGDYIFIAAGTDTTSTAVDGAKLGDYIESYVTDCIESYTSSSHSYINGHTVEVTSSDYDITVKVNDTTAYYLVNVEAYIGDSSSTALTASTLVNNTDSYGDIISVTYTYTDTGYTFTITIANAEYYNESAIYVKADTNKITASSDKNTHVLSSVGYGGSSDNTISLGETSMEYSTSVAFGASTGELSFVWTATSNTNTITLYSAVAATLGSGTTYEKSISESGSTTVTMDAAYSYGNTTDGTYYVPSLTTTTSGYYFLGYAAYMKDGSISNDTSDTLTFTDIAVNSATFNSTDTYYAIWGTSAIGEISSVTVATEGTSISSPTMNSGTFYSWYAGYETKTYSGTITLKLTNNTYSSSNTSTYTSESTVDYSNAYSNYSYAVFDTETENLVNEKYIYYARMSYSLTITYDSKSDYYYYFSTTANCNAEATQIKNSSAITKTADNSGTVTIYEGNFVWIGYQNYRYKNGKDDTHKTDSEAVIMIFDSFDDYVSSNGENRSTKIDTYSTGEGDTFTTYYYSKARTYFTHVNKQPSGSDKQAKYLKPYFNSDNGEIWSYTGSTSTSVENNYANCISYSTVSCNLSISLYY